MSQQHYWAGWLLFGSGMALGITSLYDVAPGYLLMLGFGLGALFVALLRYWRR